MSVFNKGFWRASLILGLVAILILIGATLAKKSQHQNFGIELLSERKIKPNDFEPQVADSEFRTWLGMSWDGPSLLTKTDQWIKFDGRKKIAGASITMLPGDKHAVAVGSDAVIYLLELEPKPRVVAQAELKVASRKLKLTPIVVAIEKGFYVLTFDGHIEIWDASLNGLKFISEQKITAGNKNVAFAGNANKKIAWIEDVDGTEEVCIRELPAALVTRIKPPKNDSFHGVHVGENGQIFYYTDRECWLLQSSGWTSVATFPEEQFVFVTTKLNRAAIWQLDDLFIIDTNTGKQLAHIRVRFAGPVQFSSDAKEIVVGTFGSLQRYHLTAP